MHTKNFPRDIFEQIDIELCRDEHALQKIGNERVGIFPIYDETRLPRNLSDGTAFHTTQGRFCVIYNNAMYCMPSAAVGIGPLIYAIQQSTTVSWSGSRADIWKIAGDDGVNNEQVIRFDENYHSASPVWSPDFEKIIYQEVSLRTFGSPTTTSKLCIMNSDGSNRIVLHDSGNTSSSYYYNYSMSPDGQKVAFIDVTGNELHCVFADGSGDCGGGNLTSGTSPYGNPQWSEDSQLIYVSSNHGIDAFNFQTGARTTIYAPNDLDYFWLSNDKSKFASAWYGGTNGFLTIINSDGSVQHAYELTDIPWPTGPGDQPTEVFWAPDDSFLIVTRQNQSATPDFTTTGVAVKTTPDLSSWTVFHWPSGDADDRGVVNWTLALIGGQMKLLGAAHAHSDADVGQGPGIYMWDVDTGDQEGWLVDTPNWDTPVEVFDRFSIGGLASNTSFFGAQVWDV
jgi:hypothetical protein